MTFRGQCSLQIQTHFYVEMSTGVHNDSANTGFSDQGKSMLQRGLQPGAETVGTGAEDERSAQMIPVSIRGMQEPLLPVAAGDTKVGSLSFICGNSSYFVS